MKISDVFDVELVQSPNIVYKSFLGDNVMTTEKPFLPQIIGATLGQADAMKKVGKAICRGIYDIDGENFKILILIETYNGCPTKVEDEHMVALSCAMVRNAMAGANFVALHITFDPFGFRFTTKGMRTERAGE